MKDLNLKIEVKNVGDNIDQFYNFLDKPFWFKLYLKSYFETQRIKMHGVLFFAVEETNPSTIKGCIYCELEPDHLTYGKNVPIFGWVQVNSEETLKFLYTHVEKYVKDHGHTELRGPINPPKLFGGWGAMVKGFDQPLLVDSARNDPNLAAWIENAGFNKEAEYVSLQVDEPLDVPNPFPDKNIELISIPINELSKRRTITAQLNEFVLKNFVGNLPDSSLSQKKQDEIFQVLSMVPEGENYYIIAYDHDEQKMMALIIEIPNIYEQWMGKPISTTNVNTVIVAKEYRNQQFSHWVYKKIVDKLREKNGIKIHIGGTVWSKNVPALTSFLKICDEVARFHVYQKSL
ncbi:MAG: hypothetical protein ACTSYI_15010 [Promethearchaeota archaeon]